MRRATTLLRRTSTHVWQASSCAAGEDGHRLREAYMEQSQIFMLVSARHQCHIIFSERLTATA